MAASTQCPDREELQAYVLSKVSEADARRLDEHAGKCDRCRQVLRSLIADGVYTAPIRAATSGKAPAYPFLEAPEADDEIGRLGNYRVLKLLGEGGMGYVFLAEDVTLGRPAALKVMKPDSSENDERSRRFIKEAKVLAQLKHENLVPVYNAGISGDTAYYAMELLEGESLRDRLDREGILSVDDIFRLGKELASGLAFIHQQGLIHRDIKPANIWLESPDDRVKILDLGLVRKVEEDIALTRSGIVVGSLGFMSPEQARGTPLDARTDLFSLGCVLYRLCTGVAAFEGSSTMAVLTALATETPRPIAELNPDIPPALAKLVMQLLAKDPKDRPASAEEVRDRLERINQRMQTSLAPKMTEGIQTKPPAPRPKKKSKSLKRLEKRRTRIVLGVGVGVLAVCFVIVAVIALNRGTGQPNRNARLKDAKEFKDGKDGIVPAGDKVFVKQMVPFATENWPGKPLPAFKDGARPGDIIKKNGVVYEFGIFMHPVGPEEGATSISYRLEKKFNAFHAEVSMNDGPLMKEPKFKDPKKGFPPKGPSALGGDGGIFKVYGDGKLLWTSQPIKSQADSQTCDVSVKGVDILKLEVTPVDHPEGVHAIWLDPFVSK